MLIPSIHLAKGQAVQLCQGRELEVVAETDPRELAREFGRVGDIALIDLDAARGTGDNIDLIEELCAIAPCRVGGGIRDTERAQRLLRAGARKLIIGTRAEPEFLGQFPAARLLAAVDTRDDRVLDQGWTAEQPEDPLARARRLEPHVSGFLYTLVEREGMENGAHLDRIRAFAQAVAKPVTAAGGIVTAAEIAELDRLGVDAKVGMALYKGTLTLAAGFAAVIDFAKGDGTVPTVVQDIRDGRVLLVAESTRATLAEAIDSGEAVLPARRRGWWRPDDTAAPAPRLVRVEVNCERNALLFLVEPQGPTCRRGTASCFGDRAFSLRQLEDVIRARAVATEDGSYTRRLLADAVARRAKILEEANEVIEARTRAEVRHEVADLLYHLLVDLVARDLPLSAVVTELESRRRRPD